jgi:hypothetical protein
MRPQRPADEVKRAAILARLKGTPTREIALLLNRKLPTIRGYLRNSGVTIAHTYCLNAHIAKALAISDAELREAGAIWNGHWWVGRGSYQLPMAKFP